VVLAGACFGATHANRAWAIDFDFKPPLTKDSVHGVLNTTFTAGIGVRMQSPSINQIAKGDINRDVCGPPYQLCQGLFRTQIYNAQHLTAAPGSFSNNSDRGDLNYGHKGAIFQAPAKATLDLTLTYGNFGIFARGLYFYDFVNNDFTETHPNEITPQNRNQVGRLGTDLPLGSGLVPGINNNVGTACAGLLNTLFTSPVGTPAGQIRTGLVSLITSLGQPSVAVNPNAVCGRFYGPGGYVRSKRSDGEILAQGGTNMQYLDSYFFGKLPLWGERELTFKLGRQLVNWGESTTLVLNSINSSNPVNANNFYRIGNQIEEDFVPINMIDVSFSPIDNLTVEGYYQLEWKPIEAPTPGTYFSDINVGTNNTGSFLTASFGQAPEDPDCLAKLGDNILTGLTPTCATIQRLPDWEPRTSGQYGVKLDYYFENLNNGTDVSLYYENYHSRLPYASLFSAYPSCGRREGNARFNDATDSTSLVMDCPDFPLFAKETDASKATSSALQVETAKFVLEYPEDIHLIGASFNTTVGSYSIQGEVAYRPNKPMQVDAHDLANAALGAQGGRCGRPGVNCAGTRDPTHNGPQIGFDANGNSVDYGSSDAVNQAGQVYITDTFNLTVGAATGAQRYFPNFVIPYRGGTVGENTPCYPQLGSADEAAHGLNFTYPDGSHHPYYPYNKNSPCYIRGYERMQDFQFNLGATRVYGATDNPIGADQVILVYEAGAEYVPFLPAYDQLVLQGPNSTSGPTAGADGSGADGSRMGCSNIPDCSYGPDGMRFNPHQQDHSGYPRSFSWGYRVIGLLTYEQILPNLTLKPFLLFSQDVGGISPGPAGNFVKGRKLFNMVYEFRYQQALSLSLGYAWYWGGGAYNTLSDRDFAQVFVKYQF